MVSFISLTKQSALDGTPYYSHDEEEKRDWASAAKEGMEMGKKIGTKISNSIKKLSDKLFGKKEQEEEKENWAVEENDNVDLMARLWCLICYK